MRKAFYFIVLVVIGVAVFFTATPASAVDTKSCTPCHGDGRTLSFDILEGDAGNTLPASLNVGQSATVRVVVSDTPSPSNLNVNRVTLTGVSIVLSS